MKIKFCITNFLTRIPCKFFFLLFLVENILKDCLCVLHCSNLEILRDIKNHMYVPSMTMDLKIYVQYGGSRNGLLWLSASFCTNGAENQHLPTSEFSSIQDQFLKYVFCIWNSLYNFIIFIPFRKNFSYLEANWFCIVINIIEKSKLK